MRKVLIGLTAIVVVSPAGTSRAQTFDLDILDEGKPASNVEVLALLNQTKVPVGTTDDDGCVEVPVDLADIDEGTPVDVWEIECGDRVVVVLVAPGESIDDECARRKRENPDCECEKIGTFSWGQGNVAVDVGMNSVTRSPTEGPPADEPPGEAGRPDAVEPRGEPPQVAHPPAESDAAWWGSGLHFGVGFNGRQMLRLEDVVGLADGASDAEATSFAPGLQLFVEYLLWDLVGVGFEGGWSPMETEARFGGEIQTGGMDYYELGFTTRIGPRLGDRFRPYAAFGLYRAWNKADFALAGVTDHRVHKTRRDGVGLGFDYWPGSRWGLRTEGLYSSTFEDDDADEHVRWKFGLLYRPFGNDIDEVIQ